MYLDLRRPFTHDPGVPMEKAWRRMRPVTESVLVFLLAAAAAAAAPDDGWDARVSAGYYMPEDGQIYRNGHLFELQARRWFTDRFGLALALGAGSWDLQDYHANAGLGVFSMSSSGELSVEGSVFLIPAGLSLVFRQPLWERTYLVLEAGARYVAVLAEYDRARLDLTVGGRRVRTVGAEKDDLETEDYDANIVFVLGAEFSTFLSDYVFLFAGAGYQLDFMEFDHSTLPVGPLKNDSLSAWFVRLGIGRAW